MTLTEKTTHVDEAVLLPVEYFRGKPKLAAFLTAFVNQLQELEAVFFDLLEERWLDSAIGAQLDGLGFIVGTERLGLDDTDFRAAIRARIRLNLSSGTIPDNTTILPLLISNSFEIIEWFPAAFSIIISDAFTESAAVLAKHLSRAAGVRAYLEYAPGGDDWTFTFASGDSPETDANKGFSDEPLLNGGFDSWTGDDPDDWTVTESIPNSEISEVGPDEGHGGTGVGACNLYSVSLSYAAKIAQTRAVVSGVEYRLEFNITKRISGTLGVNSEHFAVQTFFTEGWKTIDFTAASSSITLELYRFGVTGIDMTVDNVALWPRAAGLKGSGGNFAGVEVIGDG